MCTSPPHDTGPKDPLDQLREFWRESFRNLVSGSIESLESTAKQIIAIVAVLAGLYFHALVFPAQGGQPLKAQIDFPSWEALVYLLPLVLWATSLAFAIRVMSVPPKPSRLSTATWEEAKRAFEHVYRRKHRQLMLSERLLLVSLVALLFVVISYLAG